MANIRIGNDGVPIINFKEELSYDKRIDKYLDNIKETLIDLAKDNEIKKLERGIRIVVMDAYGDLRGIDLLGEVSVIDDNYNVSNTDKFRELLLKWTIDSKTEDGTRIVDRTGQIVAVRGYLDRRAVNLSAEEEQKASRIREGGVAARELLTWSLHPAIIRCYQLTSIGSNVYEYEVGDRTRLHPPREQKKE